MLTVSDIDVLHQTLGQWRHDGSRIAFVPTMGNLHSGHLSLIKSAQQHADRVIASIFVNPTQFDLADDLAAYPRTLDDDIVKLEAQQTDLLFAPATDAIYSRDKAATTTVDVPVISDILCGASRPGHFRGVTTVVCKLFNIVQPDIAVFGEKDYQQLFIIRRMVDDLNIPVTIRGEPTVREADGLAMSSRNGYLSKEQRAIAPGLYQALRHVAARVQQGAADYRLLERNTNEHLQGLGFMADYVSIRRCANLAEAQPGDRGLVVLASAWLGKARLIDNLMI